MKRSSESCAVGNAHPAAFPAGSLCESSLRNDLEGGFFDAEKHDSPQILPDPFLRRILAAGILRAEEYPDAGFRRADPGPADRDEAAADSGRRGCEHYLRVYCLFRFLFCNSGQTQLDHPI